jgi:hypothetical protein
MSVRTWWVVALPFAAVLLVLDGLWKRSMFVTRLH